MDVIQARRTGLDLGTIRIALGLAATFTATQLPAVIGTRVFSLEPGQVLWFQVIGLVFSIMITFVYQPALQLRKYLIMLLGIILAEYVVRPFISNSVFWGSLFPANAASFFSREAGVQLLRLLPSLTVWIMLLAMGFKRRDYFMSAGDMDAPTEPVGWLSIKPNDRWKKTGLSFVFMITLITLIVMVQANMPWLSNFTKVVPLLPALVFFAAMNAFNENFFNRAGLLPVLLPVFGKKQTLLLTTLFFSLGHLNFTQMGILGFLYTGLLGWILGKSMIETRGFAWAWLIQFPNDVLALTFYALTM